MFSLDIIRRRSSCRTTLMLYEFCHFASTDMALGSTYEKENKKLSGSQTNESLYAGAKRQIGVKCIFQAEHAHHITQWYLTCRITCVIPSLRSVCVSLFASQTLTVWEKETRDK